MERSDFMKELRGGEPLCKKCGGVGRRSYGSTSTWHGGIGGQMATEDICDSCWGTGIETKKGVNLKRLYAATTAKDRELESLRKENEALRELLRQCREPLCGAWGIMESELSDSDEALGLIQMCKFMDERITEALSRLTTLREWQKGGGEES